jgi:predicted RNase H-like HicB family nuclease
MDMHFTALIQREADWYVALCPELDVASQGRTVEEARAMLEEAVQLFLAEADAREVADRLGREFYVSRLSVAVG